MKHAELCSIVHNVAASLASGMGFLIGIYSTDVFGEAARSQEAVITVDFLLGGVIEGRASASLERAVARYRTALAMMCAQAGGSIDSVTVATARFWFDAVAGPRFDVTVADLTGKSSVTEYIGYGGRRIIVLDQLGRRRPKLISGAGTPT